MRLPSRGSGGGSQQLAELEKRVQEFVENQGKAPCSAQVCKRADEIARDLGMSSFRSSVQWYTKFTKKISGSRPAGKETKPREQPKAGEGEAKPPLSEAGPAVAARAVPASVRRPDDADAAARGHAGGAAGSEHGFEPPPPAKRGKAASPAQHAPVSLSTGRASGGGISAQSNSPTRAISMPPGLGQVQPLRQASDQMQQGQQHQQLMGPDLWSGIAGQWGQQHALPSQGMQQLGEHPHMQSSLAMQHQTLQHALNAHHHRHQQQQQQQQQHEAGVLAQWEHASAALAVGPMGGVPVPMPIGGMAGGMAAALQHRLTGGSLAGVEPSHRDVGPGGSSQSLCSLNLKVSLKMQSVQFKVMRRLRVMLDLDSQGIPINGHQVVTQVLVSAFKDELEPQGQGVACPLVALTYVDEDGDDIVISSNHELAVAIHHARREHQAQPSAAASEPTLRLTLHSNSTQHLQPVSMHLPLSLPPGTAARHSSGLQGEAAQGGLPLGGLALARVPGMLPAAALPASAWPPALAFPNPSGHHVGGQPQK